MKLDHEISQTLPEQIAHLTKKYPHASKSAISNLRKVILPKVMNNPKFLMCKNSARINSTFDDGKSK